jgi:hypothetical protein
MWGSLTLATLPGVGVCNLMDEITRMRKCKLRGIVVVPRTRDRVVEFGTGVTETTSPVKIVVAVANLGAVGDQARGRWAPQHRGLSSTGGCRNGAVDAGVAMPLDVAPRSFRSQPPDGRLQRFDRGIDAWAPDLEGVHRRFERRHPRLSLRLDLDEFCVHSCIRFGEVGFDIGTKSR